MLERAVMKSARLRSLNDDSASRKSIAYLMYRWKWGRVLSPRYGYAVNHW